ncbi:MAG: hypothetical protein ABIJ40_00985, partial [Bacteroidota bacterium]
MGKSVLIMVIGTIMVFSIVQMNTIGRLNGSMENSVNYYSDVYARNVCNSAISMLITDIATSGNITEVKNSKTTIFGATVTYSVTIVDSVTSEAKDKDDDDEKDDDDKDKDKHKDKDKDKDKHKDKDKDKYKHKDKDKDDDDDDDKKDKGKGKSALLQNVSREHFNLASLSITSAFSNAVELMSSFTESSSTPDDDKKK